MLRTVLWIALACAALLAVLALSRGVDFTSDRKPAPKAPAVQQAAKPAAAKAPAAPLPKAVTPPTPEELQVQEDAAATGMTTLEPPQDQPPPSEPPPASPPQR
jgi:hypothetical protein